MVQKIRAKFGLRLRAEGLFGRAIAASQGMSRKSVASVLEVADRYHRPDGILPAV